MFFVSDFSTSKGTSIDADENPTISNRDTTQPFPKLNKPELVHNKFSKGKHSAYNPSDKQIGSESGGKSSFRLTEQDLTSWNLIYVSRDSPIDRSFTVDLVEIEDGFFIDVRIHKFLESMIRDAAEDGVILEVCSAYRSASTQRTLIERKAQSMISSGLDIDIAYNKAMEYLAGPGESEHHTGLAVDFITPGKTTLDESFADTEAFVWLSENAFRYGFILRYPKDKENITGFPYEPWHYRYVGKEHALPITSKGICLEEYLASAK